MANEYAVNQADLKAVADAIRTKGGTSDALTFPGGFVDAVGAIQAGGGGGDGSLLVSDMFIDGSFTGDYINETVLALRSSAFRDFTASNMRFKAVTELIGNASSGFYFQGTGNLKTLVFDQRITVNGAQALAGSSVEKIVCKQGVSKFGNHFFYNAKKINALVMGGAFSSLSSNLMLDQTVIGTGEGYIYVPSELVETYKAATNWTVFADKIRAIEDYPGIEEF